MMLTSQGPKERLKLSIIRHIPATKSPIGLEDEVNQVYDRKDRDLGERRNHESKYSFDELDNRLGQDDRERGICYQSEAEEEEDSASTSTEEEEEEVVRVQDKLREDPLVIGRDKKDIRDFENLNNTKEYNQVQLEKNNHIDTIANHNKPPKDEHNITQSCSETTFDQTPSDTSSEQQHQQYQGEHRPSLGPYQLRAFSSNNSIGSSSSSYISSLDQHHKQLNSILSGDGKNIYENANVTPSLSSGLVNETLNYFVNCRQRLNQMTKTYDDTDAYILLLQEKEVDLELAARIGQDLLRQNKQLRESLQNLEKQLSERQDDIQQLKHDLASKSSLLEAFIEEEEEEDDQKTNNNKSTSESFDDLISRANSQSNNINKLHNNNSRQHNGTGYSSSLAHSSSSNYDFLTANNSVIQESDENDFDHDDDRPYSSLTNNRLNNHSQSSTEHFSSLPPYYPINNNRFQRSESTQPISRDGSSSCIFEHDNHCSSNNQRVKEQQKLVESVTFRLAESNKRLCELQDELLYKCEQNMMQQEKIYQLKEQLNETDRRLCDMSANNETLQKSIINCEETKRDLLDELRSCKHNFNELLQVFLEMQKETKTLYLQQQEQQQHYYHDLQNFSTPKHVRHKQQIFIPTSVPNEKQIQDVNYQCHQQLQQVDANYDIEQNQDNFPKLMNENVLIGVRHDGVISKPMQQSNVNSVSLLDEIQESMQLNGEKNKLVNSDSDCEDNNLLYNNNSHNFESDGTEINSRITIIKNEDDNQQHQTECFNISTRASSTTATVYVVSSILLILLAKKSYSQLTYK